MPQNLLESRISSFSLWENTDEYSVMHNLAYEERDHIERELNSYGCKSSLIGLRFGLSGEWQSYMNEARDFNIRDKTACWHEAAIWGDSGWWDFSAIRDFIKEISDYRRAINSSLSKEPEGRIIHNLGRKRTLIMHSALCDMKVFSCNSKAGKLRPEFQAKQCIYEGLFPSTPSNECSKFSSLYMPLYGSPSGYHLAVNPQGLVNYSNVLSETRPQDSSGKNLSNYGHFSKGQYGSLLESENVLLKGNKKGIYLKLSDSRGKILRESVWSNHISKEGFFLLQRDFLAMAEES